MDELPADMDEKTALLSYPQRGRDADQEALNDRRDRHRSGWTSERLALLLCGLLLTFYAGFDVLFLREHAVHRWGPIAVSIKSHIKHRLLTAAHRQILRSRSPNYVNIDPCEDFRSYMCEGFDQTHDIRVDQSSTSTLSSMAEDGQTVLRHILEAPMDAQMASGDNAEADKQNFEKLQGAYRACMNETAIKARGIEPVVYLVRELLEHADVSNSEVATSSSRTSRKFDLPRALSFLMSIGVAPLIELGIEADEKNPDVNMLYIVPPRTFGLPTKEYYQNSRVVETYTEMIKDVRKLLDSEFGLDPPKSDSIEDLVKLEKRLAAASPDEEVREDITKYYNAYSLKNASDLTPQLRIEDIVSRANSKFKPEQVIVASPSYMEKLDKIIEDTPESVLEAYVTWKLVQNYASAVDSPILLPLKRFDNVLGGKEPDAKPERWRTCLRSVDNGLGWLLSRFYIEKAFSEDSKEFGDQIILDIKEEFTHKLNAAQWMSKDVRKVAIEKVHNIVQKIGYPTKSPDIRKPQQLRKYYANVSISAGDHFINVLSVQRDASEREWKKAEKPVDREEWGMTASTVNAYYSPPGNQIVFPAGIMQAPIFYPPSLPLALSYGAFGAVAGHELSHAFDSSGRHFNQNGAYADSWWDDATIAAFQNKTSCFVHEYANFTVPGLNGEPLHVNGRLTLGENLADAGGLSAAFNAWQRREAEQRESSASNDKLIHGGEPQSLPGLQQYTAEQLFFLAFGNVWCGTTRPALAARLVYSDPHSPTAARILGTVANSGEFREAFKCKGKKPTCKLW